jgi:hypothetical protein
VTSNQPPDPLELLRDKRAIVDTGLGPVLFVIVYAIAGVNTAAAVAVGVSVVLMIERLLRGKSAVNAIGGLLGTGLAAFIAVKTGRPEGYFVPRMLYQLALAVVFAGEPSHTGDRLANVPKTAALKAAPLWRKALKVRPAPHDDHEPQDHALESVVDVHAFVPNDLQTHAAGAGFTDVRVQGEELLANWFGWFNRTLEATADPKDIPRGWIQYAYRGYIALQRVDRAVLEPRLPPRIFYNLMLAARKPV